MRKRTQVLLPVFSNKADASAIYLTTHIIWVWYDLILKAEKGVEMKEEQEKIKGEKAWKIENVALALLLQNGANEISVWIFEGIQRLHKVTERKSFYWGNGNHYSVVLGSIAEFA